jgi:hypothetical protein
MLECHGMEVGLHPLSFVVDGGQADVVSAASAMSENKPGAREFYIETDLRLTGAGHRFPSRLSTNLYIATPHQFHRDHAILAANAGKQGLKSLGAYGREAQSYAETALLRLVEALVQRVLRVG